MSTDETQTIESVDAHVDPYDGDQHHDDGYATPTGGYDAADEDLAPVVRPRRRVLTGLTAVLVAGVVAAAGFFGGVEVQKHQGTSTSSAAAAGTSGLAALARRFAGAGGATAGAAGGTGTGAAGGTGTGATGAAAAGGTAAVGSTTRTAGTVKLVDGKDIYVTTAAGNTVLATTNTASTLTKTATATLNDVTPGQTVVMTGIQNKDGSMTVTSLSVGATGGGFGFGRGAAAGAGG